MKTLLKGIHILYPDSAWHQETMNILVENGHILAIGQKALETAADKTIDGSKLLCLPGLVDTQCSSGEPGHEYKEDLKSLAAAASAGGYTDVFVLPGTDPVIDTGSQVKVIRDRASDRSAKIHAYGAISKGLGGVELSEMFDMHSNEAIAFSDGKHPVKDVNMMKRALEYAQGFGGLVCSFPVDERLNPGGYVHEGPTTTRLGLKSLPSLAEELMLNRDLYLLEYTGSKMHVSTVSAAASVKLLADAKAKGLDVSAAVALSNLLLTDDSLNGFDANYKTNPPLRSEEHRQALIEGLKDGIIDMICTDHTPENIEEKDVEFDQAASGMTMLETALSLAYSALNESIGKDQLVMAMAINPRKRFGLNMPSLEQGQAFDFTVFDPNATWTYDKSNCKSKSHNSPWFGKELTGRIIPLNN